MLQTIRSMLPRPPASAGILRLLSLGLASAIALGIQGAIVAQASDAPESRVASATALVEAGRFDDAEALLAPLVQKPAANALAFNLLGRIRAAQKKWKEAQESFASGRDLAPKNAIIRQNLGIALFEQRLVKDATGELAESIRLDPTLSLPHLYLGRIAEENGDGDAAEREFRVAAELTPKDPWPQYFLGGYLLRMRKAEAAAACFEAALARSPDLPAAHWNLGLALTRLDRKADAAKHFARFRELSDAIIADQQLRTRVTSRMQAAQREIAEGRHDAALRPLLEAASLAPDVAGVHLLLAEVYRLQDRPDDEKKERALFDRLSQGNR